MVTTKRVRSRVPVVVSQPVQSSASGESVAGRRWERGETLSISGTLSESTPRHSDGMSRSLLTVSIMIRAVLCLVSSCLASININTLPPDLRRLDFLDHIPPRSTINPVWSGDYSAALDGEQNKVLLSWSVMDDQVEFQVGCVSSNNRNP